MCYALPSRAMRVCLLACLFVCLVLVSWYISLPLPTGLYSLVAVLSTATKSQTRADKLLGCTCLFGFGRQTSIISHWGLRMFPPERTLLYKTMMVSMTCDVSCSRSFIVRFAGANDGLNEGHVLYMFIIHGPPAKAGFRCRRNADVFHATKLRLH